MSDLRGDRRRVQRVRPLHPLRGAIGGTRVFLVDVSLRGMRVAHQEDLGKPGTPCVVTFEWDGRPVEIKSQVIWTKLMRAADAKQPRNLYHSGLGISQVSGASAVTLRTMIEALVARALDEQKANARGIPAISAQSFQTGKGREYVRHELSGNQWRATPTTDPKQPSNGFTVSAEHAPHEVEMLRSAYEHGGGREGHELIRRMAELSISAAEGIPTRRYEP